MRLPRIRPRRRVIVLIVCAIAALAVAVSVGVVGLIRGPEATPISSDPPDVPPQATRVSEPSTIAPTHQSVLFAQRVADALFWWDTRAPADLTEWAQPLVDVADPDDAPAVAADVRTYLPDSAAWEQLRRLGTRQWLDVGSITVPDQWPLARQEAAPGQLPPGAAAYTVTGVRHREGVFETRPVTSSRRVSFTIFIACPDVEPCRLLRLSVLDNPLP